MHRFFFLFFGETVSSACTSDTVAGATAQGFFVSVFNCLNQGGGPACLGEFIAANAEGNAFPITGACRTAYAALVTGWANGPVAACAYSGSLSDKEFPPGNCLSEQLSEGMFSFFDSAGFFPFYPQCTIDAVRQYARASSYGVLTIANTGTGSDPIWVGSSSTVMCDFCYESVFGPFILNQAEADPNWAAICHLNPSSSNCTESAPMIEALNEFQQCAGSQINFLGPVCTPTQVAVVEQLVPRPYFEFANCAYHPTISYCPNIQDYLTGIFKATNSTECDLCYQELRTDINNLVNSTGSAYCAADVFADDCLGYNQGPLYNFQTCSGSAIATSATASPQFGSTATTTAITVTTSYQTTKSVERSIATYLLVAMTISHVFR